MNELKDSPWTSRFHPLPEESKIRSPSYNTPEREGKKEKLMNSNRKEEIQGQEVSQAETRRNKGVSCFERLNRYDLHYFTWLKSQRGILLPIKSILLYQMEQ